MILVFLACTASPSVQVQGRSTTLAELTLTWPEGWTVVVDPSLFRGGLLNEALEARREGMQLALSHHALPQGALFEGANALDRLLWVSPAPRAAERPGYRLRRLPGCWGAVERVLEGDSRQLTQLALTLPSGVALLSAWGELDPEALRALACDHSRIAP